MKAGLRRASLRGILSLLAVGVALGAGELLTRWQLPELNPSGQVAFAPWSPGSPPLGPPGAVRRQRKNTGDYDVEVTFGPDGFRERRPLATSTEDDLYVVGDSFAFGWGVEEHERFSSRLERLERRRVFNVAIPGQDLEGYARLVAWAVARGARPRQLVVAVCMENDVQDYDARHVAPVAPSPSLVRRLRWRLSAAVRNLLDRSALYALGTTAVHAQPWLERVAVAAGLVTPNLAGIPRNVLSERVIGSSVARCAALAGRFEATFVLIPSRGLWAGPSREGEAAVHTAFVEALGVRGLRVVDLRPELERRPDPLLHHFARDGHWNAFGHAVAARAIVRELAGSHAAVGYAPPR